jgi:hypothetical protein
METEMPANNKEGCETKQPIADVAGRSNAQPSSPPRRSRQGAEMKAEKKTRGSTFSSGKQPGRWSKLLTEHCEQEGIEIEPKRPKAKK